MLKSDFIQLTYLLSQRRRFNKHKKAKNLVRMWQQSLGTIVKRWFL